MHQIPNVSRLVLQLSLPNPMKPGVKSRMKMYLEQRQQAMLQLHLSDRQFYCPIRCAYIRDLKVDIPIIKKRQLWDCLIFVMTILDWQNYIYVFTLNPFGPQGIVVPWAICLSVRPSVLLYIRTSHPLYHYTVHNISQILFIFGSAIDHSKSRKPKDYGVSMFIF